MYNFVELVDSKINSNNKKIGLSYPIAGDIIFFNQTNSTMDEKRISLFYMLNTYKGEIPLSPTFGCKFKDLVFEINDIELIKTKVKNDVQQQLKLWHEDTELSHLDVSQNVDLHTVQIELYFIVHNINKYEISFNLIFKI